MKYLNGSLNLTIILSLLFAATSSARDADQYPNIVVILSDDLGYGSVNSYGASKNHIRTPNIDNLAREGRRFTDACTPSSVCTPTRYGLLTGRYCWRTSLRHGVLGTKSPLLIETTRPTIASLLKSVGYRTAAIGKWHLGYGTSQTDYTKPLTPGPLDIGFDYHFGVPQNHGDATGIYVRNRKTVGLRSSHVEPSGKTPYGRAFYGYDAPHRVDENVMDELTTDAVQWLGQQTDETPFFLLVDMFATVAAVVGESLPSPQEGAEDSFNVLPAFLGRSSPSPLRPSIIVHSVDGNFAIRKGPWKYIEGKASPTVRRVSRRDELGAQLYNIRDDPGERENLIDAHPEIVKRLADLLEMQRDRGTSR